MEYLAIFTLMNSPCGVMPICKAREEDLTYDDHFDDAWTRAIRNDMVGQEGMPVSVQVVGLPWEDETVLGVMKAIEE